MESTKMMKMRVKFVSLQTSIFVKLRYTRDLCFFCGGRLAPSSPYAAPPPNEPLTAKGTHSVSDEIRFTIFTNTILTFGVGYPHTTTLQSRARDVLRRIMGRLAATDSVARTV